jgi:hypothetical protein
MLHDALSAVIQEGKLAFRWTRLSCRRFRTNEVRQQPHALACHLAALLRCIVLPEAMAHWSLASLHLTLLKITSRIAPHARTFAFQHAEVTVNAPMVPAVLATTRRLRAPPSYA